MVIKDRLLKRQIKISTLGTLIPPTVEEIIDLDEETFNKILLPFILELKDLNLNSDFLQEAEIKLGRPFSIYDYLLLNSQMVSNIVESLKFFYKNNDVYFYNDITESYFIIDYYIKDGQYVPRQNAFIVSYRNWGELCDWIKAIMLIKNNKNEERKVVVEHEENKAILEEYLRLQKQAEEERKKLAQKNALSIHDIITIVASQNGWDYDKVHNMTYYQLINSYKAIVKIDNYETSMRYHTSYKFDTGNIKIENWMEAIRKDD